MSTRNWIAIGLTVVSLGLLVPGLLNDALNITATIPLLKKPIFEETQSILRAIRRLYDSENYFVAALILLFSVIVPFIKMALLGAILSARSQAAKYRMYLFTRSISKWAMADVFAVDIGAQQPVIAAEIEELRWVGRVDAERLEVAPLARENFLP